MQTQADAVVALDIAPRQWLRFAPKPGADGIRTAELLYPDSNESDGWCHQETGDLRDLCERELDDERSQPIAQAAQGMERVLLLTLIGQDSCESERELAELEGLVRSAGGQPVAVMSQKSGSTNPQTLWGKGKLQEAALEVRRNGASLVITDRELTPVQARNIERLVNCPVSDRSELILDIFAQRAGSAAGRLQVELAQLRYRLPRLLGRGQSMSRKGAALEPEVLAKPNWKKTVVRSVEELNDFCGINSNCKPIAAVFAINVVACHGLRWLVTPTPENPVCLMPSADNGKAIASWQKTNCSPRSIPRPENSICLALENAPNAC
jgi:hypothetical protein